VPGMSAVRPALLTAASACGDDESDFPIVTADASFANPVPDASQDIMAPAAQSLPAVVLILSSALGPFAMHFLVPAIPLLSHDFSVSYGTAQLVVAVYLLGFSIAQLAYGPLSDRYGRRPLLLAGVALFFAGTAACALAQSVEALMTARLVQAVGGVAGMVLSRAIVTDCFGRDKAAGMLGYITMAIVICSLASPAAGGLISDRWGWRMCFFLLMTPAAFVLLATFLRLRETNLSPSLSLSFTGLVRIYVILLRQRTFLPLAIAIALGSASWFAFIATMPFIVVTQMGRPASDYGLFIAVVSLGFIAGNFLTGRFSVRIGTKRMMAIGTALLFGGALLIPILWLLEPASPWSLFLPMTVSVFGGGMFMPNAMATALALAPQNAGAASGLLGFIQMSLSAAATVLVGGLHDGTAIPMIVIVTGATAMATAIMIGTLRQG
jgi:DHA1 family bicyclomycin/chloramphenicol resistance-like MFS transporter